MAIRKKNGKFCVYSSDFSKELGCHKTRKGALKQLRAVEISKSNRKKRYK